MRGDSDREDPDRIDLTPLDPLRDEAFLERHVGRIRAAATPELVRRQSRRSVMGQLLQWARPILAISVCLALMSVVALVHEQRHAAKRERGGIAEALGVPSSLSGWVNAGERPEAEDLWELDEVLR